MQSMGGRSFSPQAASCSVCWLLPQAGGKTVRWDITATRGRSTSHLLLLVSERIFPRSFFIDPWLELSHRLWRWQPVGTPSPCLLWACLSLPPVQLIVAMWQSPHRRGRPVGRRTDTLAELKHPCWAWDSASTAKWDKWAGGDLTPDATAVPQAA